MNPHQKPLEISKPMWTTIAVVMGIALVGKLSEPEQRDRRAEPWRGAFMSEDLTVTRHLDTPIEFPQLGLIVTPVDDWSCLTTTEIALERRPTFVNEKSRLIARLARFPFSNWPPEIRTTEADRVRRMESDKNVPEVDPASLGGDLLPVQVDQYQHVGIQWIRLDDQPTLGAQMRLGRIESDSIDVLLTVIRLSQKPDQTAEVQSLCDGIEPISTP